ncbi:hypothetical protein GLAREA_06663 [Glarea lozoyensis ATCC 20868]|uniref:Rhodopsin domain-containing protein n=1 Tax=Glarea lozoyensis (strain ATCC 20868 / MF5171) TaxID=1116229 RepID=S3D788_GLAL2|nr:uncharacterized protein GLAREA_06663 [Glarea lozoyensis ATCC 20868]EPE33650.1 hypothetical protein GLAREA_06663 [Glarea lozoyensis ATCC 20868]
MSVSTTPAMTTMVMATPSKAPEIIAVGITFLVINTLSIGTRTYSQIVTKKFNFNDVGMLIVLAVFGCLVAFLILGANSGIGKHTPDVLKSGIQNVSDSLKWIFFLEFFYVFLTTVMKASIATTFLQWATTRVQKWILWGSIVVDFAIGGVVSVYTVVQCTPISFSWERLDPAAKGMCRDPNEIIKVGYALCFVTVTLDILFLVLPFVMLRHYKPSPRIKMCVYGIIFIGVLASIANFIRIAALSKLGTYKDPLYDAADVFLWSFLEVSLGITVAGILELAPLMQRLGVKGFENVGNNFVDIDDDTHRLVVIGKPKSFDS